MRANKRKQVYMGTTKIEADRTAAEIIAELVRVGAKSVNTDYKNGKIDGIRWIMSVNGNDTLFEMPARVDPVVKILGNREQGVRTAWRQLLRWVQAQNAMIETGMVHAAEVYFAYHVPEGSARTLFEIALDSPKFKLLGPPQ